MLPYNQASVEPYHDREKKFITAVYSAFSELTGEIGERNNNIQLNDQYIYGDLLERSVDIPLGHDLTPINWLKRVVEIHRTQFMGKGFAVTSTYDTEDLASAQDDQDKERLKIENDKRKANAEIRRGLIDAIIRDNGGFSLFGDLSENASAVGTSVIKAWYDEDQKKYILSPIESVENCYALWNKDDFRNFDAFAYVSQISKQAAMDRYEVPDDVQTSTMGEPFGPINTGTAVSSGSTQTMVTVMEVTGKIPGWSSEKGVLQKVRLGQEKEINVVICGNYVHQIIDTENKLPRYYILPNKRTRRRAWGSPDITRSAISINLTYIEAFSDWRSLAQKVNFPKYKYFGFAPGQPLPKPKPRAVQGIPLVEGQDIVPLNSGGEGQAGERDLANQLVELQQQFVREVGISKILFDAPDMPTDSGQTMITAMKSIGDLVENKRAVWSPIITKIFEDALNTLAAYDGDIKDIMDEEENWHLRVSWPSMLNRDDPVYQTILLNRFNANTMSLQTYLESQGESREEIDRLRNEMEDVFLAAIHGKALGALAQMKIMPPGPTPPKVNVSLRGNLTPNQEGNLATQQGFNEGPFPATIGPQGNEGLYATDRVINEGLIEGGKPGAEAIQRDAQGNEVEPLQPGQQPQPGQAGPQLATPTANNQPGQQPMSQPGTGNTAVSGQGALNQQNQNQGG